MMEGGRVDGGGSAVGSVMLLLVLCMDHIQHKAPVRSVAFSHGDRMILTVQDNSMSQIPTIFIHNLASAGEEQTPPVPLSLITLFLFV